MTTATAPKSAPVAFIPRARKVVADRTADIISGIFPETSASARATHKFFATFLTVVSLLGFLVLLGVNTLLAQDAFTLAELKVATKAVADQRDAITRRIDSYEAPENLAAAASALGMRPSETPVFLDLTPRGDVAHG